MRELSRTLAGSSDDTFIKLWEGWGDPSKSWVWQSLQSSHREQNNFASQQSFSLAIGLFSPGSFVKLGFLSFDICFSFWTFPLITNRCCEFKLWERQLHFRHGALATYGTWERNPVPGTQRQGLGFGGSIG